jgi:hypothetical protein
VHTIVVAATMVSEEEQVHDLLNITEHPDLLVIFLPVHCVCASANQIQKKHT